MICLGCVADGEAMAAKMSKGFTDSNQSWLKLMNADQLSSGSDEDNDEIMVRSAVRHIVFAIFSHSTSHAAASGLSSIDILSQYGRISGPYEHALISLC